MIAEGTFPFAREEIELETSPRVGDGVIVIDDETRVRFASPNAVSSMHRMGIHAYATGQLLARGRASTTPRRARRSTRACPSPRSSSAATCRCSLRVLPMLDGGEIASARS